MVNSGVGSLPFGPCSPVNCEAAGLDGVRRLGGRGPAQRVHLWARAIPWLPLCCCFECDEGVEA